MSVVLVLLVLLLAAAVGAGIGALVTARPASPRRRDIRMALHERDTAQACLREVRNLAYEANVVTPSPALSTIVTVIHRYESAPPKEIA